ncbi:MAG: haloacid dehalogenase-like hydrolase [Methanosarcinaceae archaeon]|nr:haloacid dehalogenase-like hydrolase [Methanosarcinaceae archaeon]
MTGKRKLCFCFVFILILLFVGMILPMAAERPDPLPSWNEGPVKSSIKRFVEGVVAEGTSSFVQKDQRIAVFDNDGTLWSEQPAYVESLFTADRIRTLAPSHPEWKTQQPFKAVLENDWKAFHDSGEEGVKKIYIATHAGTTTAEFEKSVLEWIARAKHPRFERPYTDLAYQPMLELLAYLRHNGFKTFIVSGGSIDFMRPWVQRVYGIPPEQVVGSSQRMRYELRDGEPVLVLLPQPQLIDDYEGKAIGIQTYIGRRPIAAFGNSDGDLQMLQWTAAGEGPRLLALVHHTDAEREWAYDRKSSIGHLDKAMDEALKRGWTIVDMKRDWKRIYPFQEAN